MFGTEKNVFMKNIWFSDDFKPASVDVTKEATVEVEANNRMTVTVPHLDGAGIPHTVFKGNQKPAHKECVLIIDHETGEITLERLSSNILVKKTRYSKCIITVYLFLLYTFNKFWQTLLFVLADQKPNHNHS